MTDHRLLTADHRRLMTDEWQGSFDATLSFSSICLLFALLSALMVPLSWLKVMTSHRCNRRGL